MPLVFFTLKDRFMSGEVVLGSSACLKMNIFPKWAQSNYLPLTGEPVREACVDIGNKSTSLTQALFDLHVYVGIKSGMSCH